MRAPSASVRPPRVGFHGLRGELSLTTVAAMAAACVPERRMMPMPPRPGGVEIAAMVSVRFRTD
jgi:hypothetical protein